MLLGCLPELGDKTWLLKSTYTLLVGNKEIKLELTYILLDSFLNFYVGGWVRKVISGFTKQWMSPVIVWICQEDVSTSVIIVWLLLAIINHFLIKFVVHYTGGISCLVLYAWSNTHGYGMVLGSSGNLAIIVMLKNTVVLWSKLINIYAYIHTSVQLSALVKETYVCSGQWLLQRLIIGQEWRIIDCWVFRPQWDIYIISPNQCSGMPYKMEQKECMNQRARVLWNTIYIPDMAVIRMSSLQSLLPPQDLQKVNLINITAWMGKELMRPSLSPKGL